MSSEETMLSHMKGIQEASERAAAQMQALRGDWAAAREKEDGTGWVVWVVVTGGVLVAVVLAGAALISAMEARKTRKILEGAHPSE